MIVLESKYISLKVNESCIAESLVLKKNGEELLDTSDKAPLFSIIEERPYNNEIKLAYPNKLTEFKANRVRREGNKLIVGFELIHFEAVVDVCEKDGYIAFTLSDFIVPNESCYVHTSGIHLPTFESSLPQKRKVRLLAWCYAR